MPALATSTSMRAVLPADLVEGGVDRGAVCHVERRSRAAARPPRAPPRRTSPRCASAVREVTTTRAPSSASRTQVARPMPVPAPVDQGHLPLHAATHSVSLPNSEYIPAFTSRTGAVDAVEVAGDLLQVRPRGQPPHREAARVGPEPADPVEHEVELSSGCVAGALLVRAPHVVARSALGEVEELEVDPLGRHRLRLEQRVVGPRRGRCGRRS